MGYQTVIKKPVLSGSTPRLTFQIVDEDDVGFQPDTLTMSIYDVACVDPPASSSSTLVNSRNDVDVLANCDINGNVELFLTALDTTVTVPSACVPATVQRKVLFTWTWDTNKVGKHEVVLTIAPDRETVAT